ncbi:MAG TPA: VOC family protein [Actinomycetota bacterium]
MPHYSRLYRVVVDVPEADHDEELAFWQGAIGKPLDQSKRHPEYHGTDLADDAWGILVQKLGEGTNRVHLDIHTDDLEAEVARLKGLGAEEVQRINRWCVMRDPAGMVFCVIPDPPGTLNDRNARRWD